MKDDGWVWWRWFCWICAAYEVCVLLCISHLMKPASYCPCFVYDQLMQTKCYFPCEFHFNFNDEFLNQWISNIRTNIFFYMFLKINQSQYYSQGLSIFKLNYNIQWILNMFITRGYIFHLSILPGNLRIEQCHDLLQVACGSITALGHREER